MNLRMVSDGTGGKGIDLCDVQRTIKNIGTIAGILVALVAGSGGIGVYKYQQTAKEALASAREHGEEHQRIAHLEQKVEFLERGTVASLENRLDKIQTTQAAIQATQVLILQQLKELREE